MPSVAQHDDHGGSFDREAFLRASLDEALREQGRTSPLPPWIRHPEIPRYSIGWRMGDGEGYLVLWWTWAEGRSAEEKTAYFREFAPIETEWVDWVGMQIVDDDEEEDDDTSFEAQIRKYGEAIAHLGLYDVEAWQAYLKDALTDDDS
jgi:hypothetical protein